MSQFDEKVEFLLAESEKLGFNINVDLFKKIAKSLGPSIYNDDASLVAITDPVEIQRVKDNFLTAKLGISDPLIMNAAISEVIDQFGASNRNKYRLIFYYLLVEHFGKRSVFT